MSAQSLRLSHGSAPMVNKICSVLLGSQQIRHIQQYAGLMLGRRRRRWASNNPASGQWLVVAGILLQTMCCNFMMFIIQVGD